MSTNNLPADIANIFKAIVAHTDDNAIAKIFFQLNKDEYLRYIPEHVKANPQFVKKCIKKGLIHYNDIPIDLQNKEFITQEDYSCLIKHKKVPPDIYLYSPNKETLLATIKAGDISSVENLPSEYLEDLDFMTECFKIQPNLIRTYNRAQDIFSDKQRVCTIIQSNKGFFDNIPETVSHDDDIYKEMLTNSRGYNILKRRDLIRKITNPEIVLLALEINQDIKVIHQKFSTIIKKNDAKSDAYNFFKTYIMQDKLQKSLEHKEKSRGMKI